MKTLITLMIVAGMLAPLTPHAETRPHNPHSDLHGAAGMVSIPGGYYHPFLRRKDQPSTVRIHPFMLDANAVTNEEFLEFVKANPEWARSKVSRLFADPGYLKQWAGDLEIGNDKIKNSPVTNVSWFAANAYAKWKGERLPTQAEWEYAAAAAPVGMNKGAKLTKIILAWYDHPNPAVLPNVRSTYRNSYGLYDMHGLVWEWVNDFNGNVMQGDESSGGTNVNSFFCAAGSLNSVNKEDYAAFMRYAFRQGLQARYTIQSLGFRCAKN
ncbi:MAG: formylglycine-generating enzyme family protein [Bacteroidetes bacterium]|nr:formylglycine-generating enzyme family protein [Bacteroidota bacterium]